MKTGTTFNITLIAHLLLKVFNKYFMVNFGEELKIKTMTQEVQVILTLEVDVTQSKQDIENFIKELINNHTFYSSTYNRMIYDFHHKFEIKEEAEIYKND